jgi:hypothetical protein
MGLKGPRPLIGAREGGSQGGGTHCTSSAARCWQGRQWHCHTRQWDVPAALHPKADSDFFQLFSN